jgi:hypothetical protein
LYYNWKKSATLFSSANHVHLKTPVETTFDALLIKSLINLWSNIDVSRMFKVLTWIFLRRKSFEMKLHNFIAHCGLLKFISILLVNAESCRQLSRIWWSSSEVGWQMQTIPLTRKFEEIAWCNSWGIFHDTQITKTKYFMLQSIIFFHTKLLIIRFNIFLSRFWAFWE